MRSFPSAAASKYGWFSAFGFGAGIFLSCPLIASFPRHDQGRAAVPRAEQPPSPLREHHVAVPDLDLRMRVATELANRFDHLRHPAPVCRMVVAQAAAVGVEGEPADAGDEVAVGDEPAPLALRAEAE